MKPFLLIPLTVAFVLTGCQTYKYNSIPHNMSESPMSCPSAAQENRLRSWTKKNENWLKKQLFIPISARNPKSYKARIEGRTWGNEFTGCRIAITTSKMKNNFWMDEPLTFPQTVEISFESSEFGTRICTDSYPATIVSVPPKGVLTALVDFEKNENQQCDEFVAR